LQQQLEDCNDRFVDTGARRVFDPQLLVARYHKLFGTCDRAVFGRSVFGCSVFGVCAGGVCPGIRRRNWPNDQHDGDCVMGQPGA
jgi:hypothetical protein